MSTEIRPLTAEDAHRRRVLMNHAFSEGRVVPEETKPDDEESVKGTFGLFEGSEMRAVLSIEPYTLHWGADVTLDMGGIAGVATFANARGRGYVDSLLLHSLEMMRAQGQTISALNPFAWSFYRRYGWDWVGERMALTIPLQELKSAPEGKFVQDRTGADAKDRLTDAFTAYAKQYRGVFTKDFHKWNDQLRHSDDRTTHVYTYEPSDAATAYLLWRYNSGDSGSIRDFVATTPEDYRALLSLLHYIGTQRKTANVTVPADSLLWSYVMHWDLKSKIEPVFMGRIVDFAPAMAKIAVDPATPNGALTLALSDKHAPWNNGLWRITHEAGVIACVPVVGGGLADVSLDITALSQAFWGTPSLERVRRAGQVTVENEAAYALLARLLPSAPVFTMDFF